MYYLDPQHKNAHVLIIYRNFMVGNPNFCHQGLGVNGIHTVKVLRNNKIRTDLIGVWTPEHVEEALVKNPSTTHCVIEAPWISANRLQQMLFKHPNIHFIVRSHSQVGFLQVEAGAIKIIRDMLSMQDSVLNLTVAANSTRLANFLEHTYKSQCLYLPNLYDISRVHRKHAKYHDHRTLRVSSFGALRLLKNHTTAAAAAMMIAEQRGCDLEFWVSVNREEHGKGILQSLRNMFENVPGMKLVENPWQPWSDFCRTVAHMDLCMQVSHTETFNIVAADSVAEGVPCVVSPAIEWLPSTWQVDVDKVEDMARVGSYLLSDPYAPAQGLKALETFCNTGEATWMSYLGEQPHKK